ncbi:unnamed protein product [Owenia fusiformis]|uniref:Uncharacterized protein n=1 Tax=Owenia fusiformis TaxID=6347 RepID=A0A8S4PHB9_OWEFU|nr:unnamed protein product [Owenia fusiformis]
MDGSMFYHLIIVIIAEILMACHVECFNESYLTPESLLVKHLMTNYDSNVRPVKNAEKPTVVTMDISLNQIVDVSERHQTIVTAVWLRFAWDDYFLKWNESEFGGVKIVHLQPTDVWIPDITLYTSITGQFYETDKFRLRVTSDGNIHWYIPTRFISTCKMEVQNFPYDIQICKLKFGSWGFSGLELDLRCKTDSADLASYESNGEWDVMSVNAERHSILYNCCPEPYIDVTYYIKIKRKPLYYTFNVILPCMFIMLISPFSFLVSPGCGERIQLSVTLVLSLTVFMLFVAEQLPVQSEILPLVGQYFTVAMLALTISNVSSIISVQFYHRGSNNDKLPRVLKLMAIKMAHLVCLADRFGDVIDSTGGSNDADEQVDVKLERYDPKLLKGDHSTKRSQRYNETRDLDIVGVYPSLAQCNKVPLQERGT